MTLVTVRAVSVDYDVHGRRFGRRSFRAVDHVSIEIEEGETLAVVGETGSGKSTLGRVLLGLTPPSTGTVSFEGQQIAGDGTPRRAFRATRGRVGAVFQDPYASLNPRHRLDRIIGLPLRLHEDLRGAALTSRVHSLLDRVGLVPEARFARAFPHQLSGGQRQRVAIARAIATEPRLIVADEPISALDVSIGAQILNLLRDLQSELGMAYLFISHDLSTVRAVGDRIAVMYQGRIVEQGPVEEVIRDTVHPYTQLLISSSPELIDDRTVSSPGRRGEMGSGCRFAARCPHVTGTCRSEEPALATITAQHSARCVLVGAGDPPASWLTARRRLERHSPPLDPPDQIIGAAKAPLIDA